MKFENHSRLSVLVAGVASCDRCPETPLGERCRNCGTFPYYGGFAEPVDTDKDRGHLASQAWELQRLDEQNRGLTLDLPPDCVEEERAMLAAAVEEFALDELAGLLVTAENLIGDVTADLAYRRSRLLVAAEHKLRELRVWVERQSDPFAALNEGAWLDGEKLQVFTAADCNLSSVTGFDRDAQQWGLWIHIPGERAGIAAHFNSPPELIEW